MKGKNLRIAVCIKQVPETKTVKMDEVTGKLVREGVVSIINPLDVYGIETALKLKELYDAETMAITMGPSQAEMALREALAMGIDQGALVSDRAYAGSDTWATAHILAAALRNLGKFDLIICGERATDGDTGQVGPELAAALRLPLASYVNHIPSCKNGLCRVSRLLEMGEEYATMQLPGVMTVVKEIGEPRLPTLRGKLRARKARIHYFNQKNLNLNPQFIGLYGSPTRVVKIFRPKVARQCQVIHADNDQKISQAAESVVAALTKANFPRRE